MLIISDTSAVAAEPEATHATVNTSPDATDVTSGAVKVVVSVFPEVRVGSSLELVNSVTAAAVELVDFRMSITTDPVVDAVPAPMCAPFTVSAYGAIHLAAAAPVFKVVTTNSKCCWLATSIFAEM